jgi:hypothetical protein
MYKRKLLASCVCALLCATAPVKSKDRPSLSLKNVSLVVYEVFPAADKGLCTIDREAWRTAIDFVANQSTKLKLMREREREHHERAEELVNKASEAGRKHVKYFTTRSASDAEMAAAKRAWDDAIEVSKKYSAAPKMLVFAEILEVKNGGCVGEVSLRVSAMLKPSEMIATGNLVYFPSEEIWSSGTLLIAPASSFSKFVIEISENMLKELVNDWTLSQEE